MAPEQIMGQTATERTDIYALGAVVFECFTGVVPFQRETDGAVLYAHLSEPVPPLRQFRADLPQGLDDVIAKAMAKKPEERYGTAAELLRDVKHAAGDRLAAATMYAPATEVPVAPPTAAAGAPETALAEPVTAAPPGPATPPPDTEAPFADETVLAPPGPATPPPGPATPVPETAVPGADETVLAPPGPATPPPDTEVPAEATVLAAEAAATAPEAAAPVSRPRIRQPEALTRKVPQGNPVPIQRAAA
jgi:serine/threonine-protein kinase